MHKKGITEEVSKKRSRKTVKHQRGVVGADLASIAAKRNQTSQIRDAQRAAAIQKAKAEKKDKESKKEKVAKVHIVRLGLWFCVIDMSFAARTGTCSCSPSVEATDEGRKGRSLSLVGVPCYRYHSYVFTMHNIHV